MVAAEEPGQVTVPCWVFLPLTVWQTGPCIDKRAGITTTTTHTPSSRALLSPPSLPRDLKPANLMISGNLHADVEQLYLDSGVVKVADFGLSKSLVPVDRHGSMSMSLTQVTD